jgi:hypothetical protein
MLILTLDGSEFSMGSSCVEGNLRYSTPGSSIPAIDKTSISCSNQANHQHRRCSKESKNLTTTPRLFLVSRRAWRLSSGLVINIIIVKFFFFLRFSVLAEKGSSYYLIRLEASFSPSPFNLVKTLELLLCSWSFWMRWDSDVEAKICELEFTLRTGRELYRPCGGTC